MNDGVLSPQTYSIIQFLRYVPFLYFLYNKITGNG